MVDNVNNTIALGIQPYGGIQQQLNPLNMLLEASRVRNLDTANELQKAQLQAANQEIEQKKAALIGQLAGQVLTAPDDQLVPTYKEKLGEARKAGILDDSGYQQALSRADTTPPAQLRQMLSGLQTRGLPIEQQVAQQNRAQGAGQIAEVLATDKPPATKYFDTLDGKESGGNPNAIPTLPNGQVASSARGPQQILKGTWDDLAAKNPTAGLTPEGFDGTAKNAAAQRQVATKILTANNAEVLVNNDIQPTDKNLYMAHFLGAEGATKFIEGMKANPNAPATSLVSQEAVKANPRVFLDSDGNPKTALGVYNSQTSRFYGGSTLGLVPNNPEEGDRKAKQAAAVLTNPNIDSNVKVAILGQLEKGKLKYTQIGEGMGGDKQYGFVDETNKKIYDNNGKLIGGLGADGGAQDPFLAKGITKRDSDLVGEDYLKQFSPEVQAAVKNYIGGQSMPTGNPRKGFTQAIKEIAQKYGNDVGMPADDASFGQRRTMLNNLALTTPGSLGGQINFAGTSLNHLADVAEKITKLDNVNGLGSKTVAYLANTARGLTTEQASKVNAVTGAAQHYGQEVTKFYAGSPGGEAERSRFMSTLDTAKSPLELAGALQTERDLIPGRLDQLENQIRTNLGDTPAAQKQLARIEEAKKSIPRIDAAIAKLRGEKVAPGSSPAAPTAPTAPSAPEMPKPPPGFVVVQ